MEFKIKIWSKVKPKSGGSNMTVTSCIIHPDGSEFFTCKWKDEKGELLMSDFPVEELDVV